MEQNSELAIAWFEMNCMKLNTDKCHLLISGNKNKQMWEKLDRDIFWESNNVKFLGITLDSNLKPDKHVSSICSKANRKLSALTRVAKFLPFKKRRILFKSLIESPFKYCPFMWMFHGRQIKARISKLHERAIKIMFTIMPFEELLVNDKTFTIHHQNIQSLALEMHKAVN